MKRLAAALPLLLFLLTVIPCHAASDLYCEYTPKSAKSSLFYLDVYSNRKLTGAVFELSYDESFVSFYSASTERASATVREYTKSGKLYIAFADVAPADGKLCRLSFKALQAGNVSFVLHMAQAVGAEKTPLSGWNDDTLSIKLGKEDIASSSGSRSLGVSSRSSTASSRGGKISSLSYEDEEDVDADADDPSSSTAVFDLRRSDSLTWLLIGAGIPVLMGILLWTGIVIGKKTKDSKTAKEKPGEDIPEPDDGIEEES